MPKRSAISTNEVIENYKQSCFVQKREKLRLFKFCHTGQECALWYTYENPARFSQIISLWKTMACI